MLVVLPGCTEGGNTWDAGTAVKVRNHYLGTDLEYFFQQSRDHPLFQGLRAKINGKLDEAETRLERAVEVVPDSLRGFVDARLLEINKSQHDWEDVVRYRARTDTSFSTDSPAARVIAQRPVPTVEMTSDTVTVPFDGLRVEGQINGGPPAIPIVLDTGSPGSGIGVTRAIVERFNLPVDTTVAVGRSVVPAYGIDAPKYETQIDSMSIGGVVIKNVHATVTWTKNEGPDDDKLGEAGLGAGLLRSLFDAIRYDFSNGTFSMIRGVPQQDSPPNFAIMNDGWPVTTGATAHDSSIAAVIDTGAPFSYLVKSKFPPSEETFARSGKVEVPGYTFKLDYYKIPVTFPGGLQKEEIAIQKSFVGERPYTVDAYFGTDLWEDGALVLDYKNRRTYFQDGDSVR